MTVEKEINIDFSSEDETLQLTEEEKAQIDAAVQTEYKQWQRIGNARTDEDIKSHCDARELISSYGSKILPYIKEKFFASADDVGPFLFSKYIGVMSNENDYQLTIDCIQDSRVATRSDASALHEFGRVLLRDVHELRIQAANSDEITRNEASKKLEDIASQLIEIMPNLIRRREGEVLDALAFTKTESACQFLENFRPQLSDYDNERAQRYFDGNLEGYELLHVTRREKFQTWGEFLAERRRVRNELASSYRDDFGDFGDITDPSPHIERRRIWVDESIQRSIVPATEQEIFSNVDARIEKIEVLMESLELEETVVPLTRLHLYNFLTKYPEPTEDELARELNRIQGFSKMEEEYQHQDNPLPTIGIELEVPKTSLNSELTELLKKLGIKNCSEGPDLREVNPDFSYSPWVQGQMIQELAKLGALPLEKNGDGSSRVGKRTDDVLSMHVNLGVPEEIDSEIRGAQRHTFELANDPFIYAYSSPIRIEERKTDQSWRFNDAVESKKNKANKKVVIGGEEVVVEGAKRFEMRAGEFRDFPTFRMLAEAQRIVAAVFSYIKVGEGLPHSLKEELLADLAESFLIESQSLIHGYTEGVTNLADMSDSQTAELIRNSNIKQDCRALITKYSHEIARILNNEN